MYPMSKPAYYTTSNVRGRHLRTQFKSPTVFVIIGNEKHDLLVGGSTVGMISTCHACDLVEHAKEDILHQVAGKMGLMYILRFEDSDAAFHSVDTLGLLAKKYCSINNSSPRNVCSTVPR